MLRGLFVALLLALLSPLSAMAADVDVTVTAPRHGAETAYPPCPDAGPCNNPSWPSLADVVREFNGPNAVAGDTKPVYHAIGRARMTKFFAFREPYDGPYVGVHQAVALAAYRDSSVNGAFGDGMFAAWSAGATSVQQYAIWRGDQPLPLWKAYFPHGASVSSSSCSTYGVDAGCAASLGGTFVAATYFSTADWYDHVVQSGQAWAGGHHPMNINYCGVESWYPCGHYTATASLLDPSTAMLPSACSYTNYTNNGNTVPSLTCSNSGNGIDPDISQFNFGLHNGIPLHLTYNTGTITVVDNQFSVGSNNVLVAAQIKAETNFNANLVWGYNTLYGNSGTYTLGQDCLTDNGAGTFTSYHSVYLQCSGRPIDLSPYGTTTTASSTSTSDYVEDFSNDGSHGEFLISNITGTQPLVEYQYDALVVTQSAIFNCCTAMLFVGPGNGSQIATDAIVDENVMVANLHGGVGGTYTNSTQVEFVSDTFTNSQITGNWSDGTGLETAGRHWTTFGTCTNATTLSGNHDLVTGANLNSWNSVGGGSGC